MEDDAEDEYFISYAIDHFSPHKERNMTQRSCQPNFARQTRQNDDIN